MNRREAVARVLREAGCVFAEDEADVLLEAARDDADVLDAMVAERCSGRPLEHVVGWAEFCGERMVVADGVFVPRIRSELLAREARRHVRDGSVVVEPCCGCGAVGAIVARAASTVELHAVDIDPVAVACARENVAAVGGRAYAGDLFAPLPASLRGRVDVVVANAPYVPSGEIGALHREARLHEQHAALDGGADGLEVQRCVIAQAVEWLRSDGGLLVVETSAAQADRTAALFEASGFDARIVRDTELEAAVVVGRLSDRC